MAAAVRRIVARRRQVALELRVDRPGEVARAVGGRVLPAIEHDNVGQPGKLARRDHGIGSHARSLPDPRRSAVAVVAVVADAQQPDELARSGCELAQAREVMQQEVAVVTDRKVL